MKLQIMSVTGKKLSFLTLTEAVFGRKASEGAIYHALRNTLANRRVGTASTKSRGYVRYSGRKPWRQKGTGRARAGTRRSPIWVGGGTIFGPELRDYHYKIPKKMKRTAVASILSQKAESNDLIVVEDFTIESGKTRDMVTILRALTDARRVLLITKEDDMLLKRSARNVPWLGFLTWNRLCVHDLFYAQKVVCMESAAKLIDEKAMVGSQNET